MTLDIPTQTFRRRTTLAALCCGLVLLSAGCTALRMGPKTVARDRFDYSSALTNSWKEQLLMNMVKVRYLEPPMFLDVAQVVASYTFEGSASVSLPDWAGAAAGPAAGASGRWAESPTIPLVGEKFIKSLLQPIPPVAIFSLVQAGWPIDAVFGVGVRAINGLYATTSIQILKKQGDTNFYLLLKMLRELQLTDAFGLNVLKKDQAEAGLVVFRARQLDEATEATTRAVRKMLGLSPDATQFSLAFGAVNQDDKEIALLTRSMLEILMEGAAGVEVPASDVEEGRVTRMANPKDMGENLARFHVHVHSSPQKPEARDAFSVVRYRGIWFWVDDRDLSSKRGLAFLMTLFTLAESGTTASPPVLTISKP